MYINIHAYIYLYVYIYLYMPISRSGTRGSAFLKAAAHTHKLALASPAVRVNEVFFFFWLAGEAIYALRKCI